MPLPPIPILLAWIPLGALLFRRFPPRTAILINFIAGWGLLPGAHYHPSAEPFPYWIEGVCLPTAYWLTKATATSLAALAGMLLFRFPDAVQIRPGPLDLPMAVWCAAPLLAAAAHPATVRQGLAGAVYLALAWGVPWLLGRAFFATPAALVQAAAALAAAALCYIPICLVEWVAGPQLYAFLYGYQPYRWIGAQRYIGFRPIGLLEDGNQLGIWMAAAALLAIALWAHRLCDRIFRIPIAWVAAALILTTLLCQSAGSILLLLLLLPLAVSNRRWALRLIAAALVVAILAFTVFLVASHATLRGLVLGNPILRSIAGGLEKIGRQSLVWRIARDNGHLAIAMRTPILGSGQWNWWRFGDARPWSLWMLVFGMYGIVGLAALACLFFLPILIASARQRNHPPADPRRIAIPVVALLLMAALDSLMNGALLLPYLLLAAGVLGPRHSPRLRRAP